MINAQRIEEMLRSRYPDLEGVGPGLYRGVDRFGSREYAVRYFDLNDQLVDIAPSLKSYQEKILSQMYFSTQVATDLRWNHYLYFVTSNEEARQSEFKRLKAMVEADREYARKQVIQEDDISALLDKESAVRPAGTLPMDLATKWTAALDQHGLGFILDDDISVPDAVRRIASGTKDRTARAVAPTALLPAEEAAANHFIKRLTITGFRPHPEQKDHLLGRVNLIVGSNGVGKTSLLEAIEFGYCGRNRRSSIVPNQTSINMELADTEEKLSSTTDTARLRARHSNWYAKTELKKISIQDSFGKFNFLDTDAAVNLSVSSSSDQIGSDITRLVLGAAAENLADRLRRVLEQIRTELKNIHRDNESEKQLKQDAQSRVDTIKSASRLSDSLFEELLSALKLSDWLKPPEEKNDLSFLRESLQEAASAIELIRHSSVNILQGDHQSALQLLENLNEEVSNAIALDELAKATRMKQTSAQRSAQAAAERVTATEALYPYARADFARLMREVREQQNDIQSREAKLSVVANKIDRNAVEQLLDFGVHEAISSTEEKKETLQSHLTTNQSSLQALEKTQNSLTVMRQRLLATAREILQNTPNPDHCPLCHSEFESGQLTARMMSDAESNTSNQISLLQAEIAKTEEEIDWTRRALLTLEPIRDYFDESSNIITVEKAISQIILDKTQLEKDRKNLEKRQEQAEHFQSNGLSSEDLSNSLLAAGITELPSVDELHTIGDNYKAELNDSQETIKAAKNELQEIQQKCEAVATRLSIGISDDTDTLVKSIKTQITNLQTALNAHKILSSFLTIQAEKSVEELSIDLSSAQKIVANITTAIAQEAANNEELDKAAKKVSDLTKRIDDRDAKISHLNEAEKVLDLLNQESSGGALTNEILNENAEEIARIFASIHMPNEFELKIEGGSLVVVRRQSGKKVETNQMSTGQRAAFALSLFLAMNSRLTSGPPIVLFDDPVAHVDDINVLSFLDHLRHLAITGSRQIFFSTADTKLAGLFRHKFRFLGDDFQEILLTRS